MVDNQMLSPMRAEILNSDTKEIIAELFGTVPAKDFYGTDIDYGDEYTVVFEDYVHADNWFKYSEEKLNFEFKIKK